ncbi:MAG: hypothetical protein GY810_10390 [Aureispira sp.]|nr:hypothetical protein [Aureispira sp.]
MKRSYCFKFNISTIAILLLPLIFMSVMVLSEGVKIQEGSILNKMEPRDTLKIKQNKYSCGRSSKNHFEMVE